VRWYGDGTEVKTGEGKLYLSVLDMGSRRILGFALGAQRGTALAYGALGMAVAVRGGSMPGWSSIPTRAEYAAAEFRQACERLGVIQSMDRPGWRWTNAVIESWYSTLESNCGACFSSPLGRRHGQRWPPGSRTTAPSGATRRWACSGVEQSL
jgi:putative transposase